MAEPSPLRRLRWLVWGAALVVGVVAGVLIVVLRSNGPSQPSAADLLYQPAATWAAGAKPAPDFRLAEEGGRPVSLSRFRGRPVILTFIDPLCTDLCPREAKELDSLEQQLPASQRPAIVAVSTNQWGNSLADLRRDDRKWSLTPQWHWAIGSPAALGGVWRDYQIAVQDQPKTVKGVVEHNIVHTEAAYVIDAHGDNRALFLWPFRAQDLAAVLRTIGPSS